MPSCAGHAIAPASRIFLRTTKTAAPGLVCVCAELGFPIRKVTAAACSLRPTPEAPGRI